MSLVWYILSLPFIYFYIFHYLVLLSGINLCRHWHWVSAWMHKQSCCASKHIILEDSSWLTLKSSSFRLWSPQTISRWHCVFNPEIFCKHGIFGSKIHHSWLPYRETLCVFFWNHTAAASQWRNKDKLFFNKASCTIREARWIHRYKYSEEVLKTWGFSFSMHCIGLHWWGCCSKASYQCCTTETDQNSLDREWHFITWIYFVSSSEDPYLVFWLRIYIHV